MRALDGVGVLVTRPQAQAAPLCRLLESHGAIAIGLPAIVIAAAAPQRELAAKLKEIGEPDLVVFTSANAVRFGAALLDQRRDLPLAAIGPATMRALNHAGYRVSIMPMRGFDSEHLLAEPGLKHLPGRRIVLVKGVGGRDLLAQELTRRGALVHALEVYRRLPARPGADQLRRVEDGFAAGGIQVVTATSLEIASALLALATPAMRAGLEQVHWLVPGARVAAGLADLGLRAPVIEAASAEDQDLVDALLRWRGAVSDA